MAPGFAPFAPGYAPMPRPSAPTSVRIRPSRPWQLIVASILAMLSGIAILTIFTLEAVSSGSVTLVFLSYLPASALVLAPIFMLMGYRWAYSFTVSGLAGVVIAAILLVVGSEAILLPAFVLVVAILATVLAPVWISLWLLLTRRVEEVFEDRGPRRICVYYNGGAEEPPMQDPKEIVPHTVVYMPTLPYYGYAGYAGYYAGYGRHTGYGPYLTYPTYPTYPGYPTYGAYPAYPGYPT